jgi:glutamine amidotransferase-like uncharacterized protein
MLDPSISVRLVDSDQLEAENWEERTVALGMGGGVCSEWEKKLKPATVKRISAFVHGGGKMILLCAAAYFASAVSCFNLKGQPPIEKRRELAFFKGRTVGPIVPTVNPNSVESARALSITFLMKGILRTGRMYCLGGGYFEIDNDTEDTKVIARHEGRAVGVLCRVDKGSAFLFSGHPEYSWPDNLKENGVVGKLAKDLHPYESFRQNIWGEICRLLALPIKC